MKTRDLFFELIQNRVCGKKITTRKEDLTNEILSDLFSLAKMHDISYIISSLRGSYSDSFTEAERPCIESVVL